MPPSGTLALGVGVPAPVVAATPVSARAALGVRLPAADVPDTPVSGTAAVGASVPVDATPAAPVDATALPGIGVPAADVAADPVDGMLAAGASVPEEPVDELPVALIVTSPPPPPLDAVTVPADAVALAPVIATVTLAAMLPAVPVATWPVNWGPHASVHANRADASAVVIRHVIVLAPNAVVCRALWSVPVDVSKKQLLTSDPVVTCAGAAPLLASIHDDACWLPVPTEQPRFIFNDPEPVPAVLADVSPQPATISPSAANPTVTVMSVLVLVAVDSVGISQLPPWIAR
jgi:hypothetical protein